MGVLAHHQGVLADEHQPPAPEPVAVVGVGVGVRGGQHPHVGALAGEVVGPAPPGGLGVHIRRAPIVARTRIRVGHRDLVPAGADGDPVAELVVLVAELGQLRRLSSINPDPIGGPGEHIRRPHRVSRYPRVVGLALAPRHRSAGHHRGPVGGNVQPLLAQPLLTVPARHRQPRRSIGESGISPAVRGPGEHVHPALCVRLPECAHGDSAAVVRDGNRIAELGPLLDPGAGEQLEHPVVVGVGVSPARAGGLGEHEHRAVLVKAAGLIKGVPHVLPMRGAHRHRVAVTRHRQTSAELNAPHRHKSGIRRQSRRHRAGVGPARGGLVEHINPAHAGTLILGGHKNQVAHQLNLPAEPAAVLRIRRIQPGHLRPAVSIEHIRRPRTSHATAPIPRTRGSDAAAGVAKRRPHHNHLIISIHRNPEPIIGRTITSRHRRTRIPVALMPALTRRSDMNRHINHRRVRGVRVEPVVRHRHPHPIHASVGPHLAQYLTGGRVNREQAGMARPRIRIRYGIGQRVADVGVMGPHRRTRLGLVVAHRQQRHRRRLRRAVSRQELRRRRPSRRRPRHNRRRRHGRRGGIQDRLDQRRS